MSPNPVTILALSLWTHSRWTMVAHHTIHGGGCDEHNSDLFSLFYSSLDKWIKQHDTHVSWRLQQSGWQWALLQQELWNGQPLASGGGLVSLVAVSTRKGKALGSFSSHL